MIFHNSYGPHWQIRSPPLTKNVLSETNEKEFSSYSATCHRPGEKTCSKDRRVTRPVVTHLPRFGSDTKFQDFNIDVLLDRMFLWRP